MRKLLLTCVMGTLIACGGGKHGVHIDLPLPPKLDLTLYDHVYFPGFITTGQNEYFDTTAETMNFFKNEFGHRDIIEVVDEDPLDLSDEDPREFFDRTQPFFANLGDEIPPSTLAVTGVVNYEVVDRSGFQQIESQDITGQPYSRTQFVEMTGYILRFRVYVYELTQGQMVFKELIQDEIDVEGPPGDTRLAFYHLLERMSDRVVGLFSNTNVRAERTLL